MVYNILTFRTAPMSIPGQRYSILFIWKPKEGQNSFYLSSVTKEMRGGLQISEFNTICALFLREIVCFLYSGS